MALGTSAPGSQEGLSTMGVNAMKPLAAAGQTNPGKLALHVPPCL